MRLTSVSLTWFRGAARDSQLNARSKSLVVYGENGAGKSSFVDGIEYAINGKLHHLAHEYSGRKQERGLLNTHKPASEQTNIRVVFADGSEHKIDIASDGNCVRAGADAVDIPSWSYPRVVLRQDEVAAFISETKGEKYSALLPLFGLAELETAAENLRQLAKTLGSESELDRKIGVLQSTESKRRDVFGEKTNHQIESELASLHRKYCPASTAADLVTKCHELTAAINIVLSEYNERERAHLALQQLAGANVEGLVADVRKANAKLAESVEPLVAERLGVLETAQRFAAKLDAEEDIACPACGVSVPANEFKEHVAKEYERLKEITAVFMERNAAISSLIDGLKTIKANLKKPELKEWREQALSCPLRKQVEWVDAIDPERLRHPSEDDLTSVVDHCVPIVRAAKEAAASAPPKIKEIADDKSKLDAATAICKARDLSYEVTRVQQLLAYLQSLEAAVRQHIRDRSQAVIDDISGDIKDLWAALRPGSWIENIGLHLQDGDKAIDIKLKFHGKELPSPRLTLSEGSRNSLGLCIFLAMAKREAASDRPLILDDVVISLDREHRGMIASLLEDQFADRQVIVLTHDRTWYTELTKQLEQGRWEFRRLLPYAGPEDGIRWSDIATDFDDARAQLAPRPDAAGNDARKIMDIELSTLRTGLSSGCHICPARRTTTEPGMTFCPGSSQPSISAYKNGKTATTRSTMRESKLLRRRTGYWGPGPTIAPIRSISFVPKAPS